MIAALLVSGCGSQAHIQKVETMDCVLEAGGSFGEGGNDDMLSVQGAAGAVAWKGDAERCKDLKVMTRSPSHNTVLCQGSEAWCTEALKMPQPVTLTPDQIQGLREAFGGN